MYQYWCYLAPIWFRWDSNPKPHLLLLFVLHITVGRWVGEKACGQSGIDGQSGELLSGGHVTQCFGRKSHEGMPVGNAHQIPLGGAIVHAEQLIVMIGGWPSVQLEQLMQVKVQSVVLAALVESL